MHVTQPAHLMHFPRFSLPVINTGDYNYSHHDTLGGGKTDQNNMDIWTLP